MKAKDTEKSFEERWIEDDSYALGKKAGIKEVVEWIELHMPIVDDWRFKDNWQAKLKEWGSTSHQ